MKKICRLLFTAAAALFLLLPLNRSGAPLSPTAQEVYDAILEADRLGREWLAR